MKKDHAKYSKLKCFYVLLFFLLIGCDKQIYQSGRDTIKSFYNGRFQIVHLGEDTHVLVDNQENLNIAMDIKDWEFLNGKLYLYDNRLEVYIVLDLQLGHFKKSKKPSDFSKEAEMILLKLNIE
ncbi:MAG: hypothetical protein M0P27_08130 [Bacteroidales bacterium]|jgi:hypothetical protein|nr:hypothetical protein [Bacteroidales bacterium]